jgi:hypothetical protein
MLSTFVASPAFTFSPNNCLTAGLRPGVVWISFKVMKRDGVFGLLFAFVSAIQQTIGLIRAQD